MKNIVKLASFALLICWLSAPAYGVELKGVVKSEKGDPLADVQILTNAPLREGKKFLGMQMTYKQLETTTDKNGLFKLPDHGRVVYFKRQDLNPITKILELSDIQVEIVMQDASSTTWKIPTCSTVPGASKRVGIVFKVALPDNVPFQKRASVDSDEYLFGFDTGGGKFEVMVNWGGSTSIEPPEDVLLSSKEFSERSWRSGNTIGYEIRGVKSDGKLWRRVSFRWGAIAYQGNSEKSARVFDKLIDSVCFDESSLDK
ncbi:MAG TPA: hypothetical protein VKE91_10755 [Blastocatellia bacterium]|nr:hypothetical protein [Blastocatellia bacterium]